MIIQVKKFGDMLISRPAGREAYLAAKAYILPKDSSEKIVLDFEGVKVLAPSWADEFITHIAAAYPGGIECKNTDNLSVKETLKILHIPGVSS